MTLTRLSLSRARVDRAGHRRAGPELMRVLLDDPATAVLPLRGPRAPITGPPGTPRLDLLAPATADERGDRDGAVLVFLGEDPQGRGYVLYATAGPATPPVAPGSPPEPGGPDEYGRRWADLRAVGDLLDDADAGLMTCAVAVASWHTRYGHCPRCGAATEVVQAGWARVCPGCGAEHYPRTDPAVIMSVVDEADRILLGRQVGWPQGRFSVLAGFVEPGESLEAAVRREVFEEAGVLVGDVAYRGSQPWPFPSSLMLGFRGEATSVGVEVDGEELAEARWWSREELALDVATGELLLPPRVSIARGLIEDWYGSELTDAGRGWS